MASWFGSKDDAGSSAMEVRLGCRAVLVWGRSDLLIKICGIDVCEGLGGL